MRRTEPAAGHAIGVDLGGTRIKGALVDAEGQILRQANEATPEGRGAEAVLDAVLEVVEQLDPDGDAPLGLGVPGLVDFERGVCVRLPNLPGWEGYDLRGGVAARTARVFALENDANCAALGEGLAGSAREFEDYLFITLGTGVGSGLVLGGELWRGPGGWGGEFGHAKVEREGRACGCGSHGCLETRASGSAIVDAARERLGEPEGSALAALDALTPAGINAAAEAGDPLAIELFETAADYLGMALATAANFLGVPAFVIGGGISRAGAYFYDRLRASVLARTFTVPADRLVICPATCGNDAGVIGAATLARTAFCETRRGADVV